MTTDHLKRHFGFGFGVSYQAARQPLPVLKVVAYSFGIVAVFIVGMILESRLRVTGYGEAFGAIPVLVCALLVRRLPPAQPITVGWGWRALLLALPLGLLPLADLTFPEFSANQAAVWLVLVAQTLGIGVSEELTFRFGLHRLWSHYGAVFYVLASSAVFGALHYPLGLQACIITGIIGAALAASRAAGMPLIPLIAFHAFLDAPMIYRAMSTA
jgi:membrane protease YdiL (CAAX protease family)